MVLIVNMNPTLKHQHFLLWLVMSLLLLGGIKVAFSQNNFWQQTNGPYEGIVNALAINSSGHIFAGTFSGGVFRSTQSTTSVKRIVGKLPMSFSLEQNYPNPFNPSTIIEFSLPYSGYVTLKVYDVLGKEVATLVNKKLSTGNYNVEWNASGFESGVYFYRLQVEGFVATKKLTLLR